MRYIFILGRNIELSKAEVFSYLETEGNKIIDYELIKKGLCIEAEKPLEKGIVNDLGGVVSIGRVIASGKVSEILEILDGKTLYTGTGNKLNYSVWDFSKSCGIVKDYLKKRFRDEKLKATLKHLENRMEMQSGEMTQMISSKLLDKEYFVFGEKTVYFGEIYETFDSGSLEKRDMEKPVRRESLAVSPRLAKILINLSGAKKGETLLDPFCGIGTILSEALIRGIKVTGIDKDAKAIDGAKKNIEWSGFGKNLCRLIIGDSAKEKISHVDAIATEPDLGEILKKTPTENEAKKTLEKFEGLIISVINNFKNDIKGRIAFTSPYIKLAKKRIGPDIERILEKTGCRLVCGIPEFRENQIVGRMIFVLEK